MTPTNEQTRLDRAIEFLAFVRAEISLILPSGNKVAVVAIDTSSQELLARLTAPSAELAALAAQVELAASTHFRGNRLTFTTRLLERNGDTLRLQLPKEGTLENRRSIPRVEVPEPARYRTRLEVNTMTGSKTFADAQLVDVSAEGLGITLRRSEGLVLPDDRVSLVRVHEGECLVLEATGTVARVDAQVASDDAEARYFVYVRLDASAQDVENEPPNVSRRTTDRAKILSSQPSFARWAHPLFATEELKGRIVDISQSGIRIACESVAHPLLSGMVLRKVTLQFPHCDPFMVDVRITSTRWAVVDERPQFRFGGELVGASSSLLKAISQVMQRAGDERIQDLDSGEYHQLLEFLFETGFVYRSKRVQLKEIGDRLQDTYSKALRRNSPIAKHIAYKEHRRILGYMSAIRFFDHTWLIQHMNALKTSGDASAAQSVLNWMVEFFLDPRANFGTNTLYTTCFYRPDNPYPTMVFGEARDMIQDPRICDFRDYDFCLLKEDDSGPSGDGFEAREGGDADCSELERLLIAQRQFPLMRIEDLTREKMLKLAVSDEYSRLGLYRFRKVFVASGIDGADKAFAVCNYASPGLNLSELTNSIRLFTSRPDVPQGLLDAVVERAIASYRQTDMHSPVLLLSPQQHLPRQYQRAKVYRHWFISALHVRRFKECVRHIQKNIKTLLGKYSEALQHAKAISHR